MDASELILTRIKEPDIKNNLNSIIYYCIKQIYNPEFSKRSRYFGKAIKQMFDELGHVLNLQINNFEQKDINTTMTLDITYDLNQLAVSNNETEDLNLTVDKGSYETVHKLLLSDFNWCFQHLVEYDDDYILDKDDDYIILRLIKNYLFSSEPAKSSSLMICYNIFASSIELMFCFCLVLNFPKYNFQKKEEAHVKKYFETITQRVKQFYEEWANIYREKYDRNKFIRNLIGDHYPRKEIEKPYVDLTQLAMSEPILNAKYVSFTKLIKEGPFCFEIEEIARQICIIDHEMLSSYKINDFLQFIIKKTEAKTFMQFEIREKQLQCYILSFILLHNNLENKKNMIQNFISLAHTLKRMNNQQTCHSIINILSMAQITSKTLLWKLVEKKYRDIFLNLERELAHIELNENLLLREKREEGSVPHTKFIQAMVNNFVIKLKDVNEEKKLAVGKEFQMFMVSMNEYAKNRYYFFRVNPLYDFFKFGFLQIFKLKKWRQKMNQEYSNQMNDKKILCDIMESLLKKFLNN